MIEVHNFKPFTPGFNLDFKRADVEIYGINHFRPSYSGLVFINAGEIHAGDLETDTVPCAGRFAVFGHEDCLGDEGHCHPSTPQRFDPRRSHPLTHAFKRIVVTEPLREALSESDLLQITIVASDGNDDVAEDGDPQLFVCQGLQVVTFA